jgi:hypothetical protein
MKPSPENVRLAKEIHGRLNQLTVPSTALVRAIRKEFSGRITDSPPESVVQLALHLLNQNSDLLRFSLMSCLAVTGPRSSNSPLTTFCTWAKGSIVGLRSIVSACISLARCGHRAESPSE